MPRRGKPEAIRDKGLKEWLDRPEHLAKHNGLGYKDFSAMIFNETPKARIKNKMGVSTNTVKEWITIYWEEKKSL